MLICIVLLSLRAFSGEAAASQLHLTWEDTSKEDGFEIERQVGTSGAFAQIAVTEANRNVFTDLGLTPETSYCYRVRAFNGAGSSGYSNVACATASTIMATFESPEDGQPVSGVTTVHGWAFDMQASGDIDRVEMFLDGVSSGDIPCCSERADVEQTFPQFPLTNTLNSGWGTTFNWGLLSAGSHTMRLEVTSTTGQSLSTQTHTVTVVKPGDFEFLDQFDLSGAVASIVGEELVLEGVVVRDKASLQEKELNTHFRWFSSSQSLGMVASVITGEIASRQSLFSSLLAFLSQGLKGVSAISAINDVHAASSPMAMFENPEQSQLVSGVGVLHGWAFNEEFGISITEARLFVDGQPAGTIPCCSARADVAAAFPNAQNALHSGWGVIFNYGLLAPGFHTIEVQIEDSAQGFHLLNHEIEVVKLQGVEFLDQFDLSDAVAWVDGQEIVIAGVIARDKATQQTQLVDVRFRWFQNAQALKLVSILG